MKVLALILFGFATAKVTETVRTYNEEEYWTAWKDFLKKPEARERHNMYLNKQEHDYRFEVFKDNLEKINAHNKQNRSWTMGVNQFADMTASEFRTYSSCAKGGSMTNKLRASEFQAPADWNKTGANSVDWVAGGAVTPVKNQGSCGSCWAFSTTGVIEGRTAITSKYLLSLSEQQLVDCSDQNGCNGGWPDQALYYVYGENGLSTESDYPYQTKVDQYCYSNWYKQYSPISTYAYVQISTSAMEAAVAAGPVSIVVDADFQSYQSGVFTANCGTSFNHAVLLVGYGTDSSGMDYWKVKNSWGSWWGEAGYIRLCRNCGRNNGLGQCGILRYGVYPLIS